VPPTAYGCYLELFGALPGGPGTGPKPDQATRGWRLEAACRELPTELFFPIGHGPRAQAQTKVAKEICRDCAVRAQCLAYALATNARYGVFGGLAEEERRDVRRQEGVTFSAAGADLEESA
jgi:WhiB family redox-sensing transcriptional regulator